MQRGTNFPTERQAPFLPSSRPGGGRRLSAARPGLSAGPASLRFPLRGGRRRRAGNSAGGGEALTPRGRVTAFLSGERENGAVTTTATAAALLRLPGAEGGVGAAVTVRSATLTSPPAGQGRPAPPGSCAPRKEKVHPDPYAFRGRRRVSAGRGVRGAGAASSTRAWAAGGDAAPAACFSSCLLRVWLDE